MTLTIELSPVEQERVAAAALEKGLDPAEFVKRLVTEHLPETASSVDQPGTTAARHGAPDNHFYFTATREEFNGALDEIARMNRDMPVLSDEAFDRENLYVDRF